MRKRLLLAGAGLAVLAVGGAALGYVLYTRNEGRDIRGSSTVEFFPTGVPATTAPPAVTTTILVLGGPGERPRPRRAGRVIWPMFGYGPDRLRSVPSSGLRPPFRPVWSFRARSLVEFPPAVAYGRLYFSNNRGTLLALNARTGRRAWRYESGRCVASSPAVWRSTVFQAFLNKPPCNAKGEELDGEVAAFAAWSGKVLWRRRIGPSETPPLVAGGRVYVGDWRGNVYALHARTGRTLWTFETGGEVKGGAALARGRLYVGSYDGHVYALDARTGALIWKASAQPRLGSSGTFYSTPAVAYGRVYIGSTDGKVYSFGAESGELRWSQSTGGYVYASPAVWRELVLAGSYGGKFYAFDAATGDVRWSFEANGPISGSATVLGNVVYFSTLERRTFALDAATGKELWSWPDGKYTPVVADSKRLYLVGYTRLYGLVEK